MNFELRLLNAVVGAVEFDNALTLVTAVNKHISRVHSAVNIVCLMERSQRVCKHKDTTAYFRLCEAWQPLFFEKIEHIAAIHNIGGEGVELAFTHVYVVKLE